MEKLIELFNEYERPQTNHIYTAYEVKENMNRLDILQEFIKWLVDNDKIDKEFEDKKFLGDIFDSGYRYNNSFMEERLLCYLALTDEPIEFLISILK